METVELTPCCATEVGWKMAAKQCLWWLDLHASWLVCKKREAAHLNMQVYNCTCTACVLCTPVATHIIPSLSAAAWAYALKLVCRESEQAQ